MDTQRILDEGRALEPQCAVASSPAARAFKARVRQMHSNRQTNFLFAFCEHDLVNLVKCILAAGVSPDATDYVGNPVLCMTASLSGSARCLKALLDGGANVCAVKSDGGFTALHRASQYGRTENVRLLIKSKAPLEARSVLGRTPLMAAVREGHVECCKVLLRAGASTHARANDGSECLHFAVQIECPAPMIDLLLDAGADLEARDNVEATPLHDAASLGRGASVRHLLDRGADLNAVDHLGDTPLIGAIVHPHGPASSVRELIRPHPGLLSGLGITNKQGRCAFHFCVVYGDQEVFDLLLPHYVMSNLLDVRTMANERDATADFNETPLMLACHFGRHAMVKTLLRLGASRVLKDSTTATPLYSAARMGILSCVVLLLGQPGAFQLTLPEIGLIGDEQGWTALHISAYKGYTRVCGVLIQAGARLDATTAHGKTPFMLAQFHHPKKRRLLALLSGNTLGLLPGTFCEGCGTIPESALLHCSGCLSVRYCCPRCATADWPRHVTYCMERREKREALL